MYRYQITIAQNDDTSDSLSLNLDDQCIVGLEIPAAITSTQFTIQGQGGDGEWKDLQKDDVDYVVAAAANTIQPLRPDLMAAVRKARIVGDANEGAERTLYFVVRGIK